MPVSDGCCRSLANLPIVEWQPSHGPIVSPEQPEHEIVPDMFLKAACRAVALCMHYLLEAAVAQREIAKTFHAFGAILAQHVHPHVCTSQHQLSINVPKCIETATPCAQPSWLQLSRSNLAPDPRLAGCSTLQTLKRWSNGLPKLKGGGGVA